MLGVYRTHHKLETKQTIDNSYTTNISFIRPSTLKVKTCIKANKNYDPQKYSFDALFKKNYLGETSLRNTSKQKFVHFINLVAVCRVVFNCAYLSHTV